jgi:hypothetical protein
MKKLSKVVKQTFDDPGKELLQKLHFITRLRQRLGVQCDDSMYNHIVACIKNKKESPHFTVRYLFNQSSRLMVFELSVPNKVPVNILYDNKRCSLVTVLYQKEDHVMEVNFYYDVFHNKIMLNNDLGYSSKDVWTIVDGVLVIPNETLEHNKDYSEVVSEGILFGKRFKIDNDTVCEVM